eukprot:TRINITY_DN26755_c0_g1_i2.p1 TRINITY_DN26755_c0_g1~~TRINITY_DN26755_c0_g1_i2.p1  ORF type:complete len:253 (+),score=26.51 TRINITY_DN26755_c0_g1_i2:121-879(+)
MRAQHQASKAAHSSVTFMSLGRICRRICPTSPGAAAQATLEAQDAAVVVPHTTVQSEDGALQAGVEGTIDVEQLVDFDAEGRKVLEANCVQADGDRPRFAQRSSSLNEVWRHPESGACLFVGDLTAADDEARLRECQIGAVVVCLNEMRDDVLEAAECPRRRQHFFYPIARWREGRGREAVARDDGVAFVFAPLLGFVQDQLATGTSVLLHWLAGAHRAGTAGVACLMYLSDQDTCQLSKRLALPGRALIPA